MFEQFGLWMSFSEMAHTEDWTRLVCLLQLPVCTGSLKKVHGLKFICFQLLH